MSKLSHPLMAALVIVAASLLAYIPAMKAGFIWDDDLYVTENPLLSAPDGLYRIWFTTDSPSQYFPLTYTTFRIEYSLWGPNPFGYHLTNISLHIINALLLLWLLSRLNLPAPWLTAAVFALHPVQVESVAWITERKNVLMGLFFLLSLLAWFSFVESSHQNKRSWHFYILSLFLCALSLLSKTTACTLPAALILLFWLKKIPLTQKRVLQFLPFVLLSLGMGLLTIWWEQHHQGTGWAKIDLTFIERILIASRALWFYLAKLLWPAELAFSYPKWNIDPAALYQYIWLVLCLAAAFFLWRSYPKLGRGPIAALIFFAATLAPMLGFISLYTFVYTYVADHYQYLAAIGPFALFTAIACKILPRFGKLQKPVAAVAPAAILLTLATLTFRQCRIYENRTTLWKDTLRKNPASVMAHINLGVQYQLQEKYDDALYHYRRAITMDPATEKAHCNMADILETQGYHDEAITHYNAAVTIDPNYAKARFCLAKALQSQNKIDPAIRHYRAYIRLRPESPEALNNLALLLKSKGNLDEAAGYFRRAIKVDPSFIEAHNNLANFLVSKGLLDEAITHYQKALAIRPDYFTAHHNLGNTLLAQRKINAAIEHFHQALSFKPDYISPLNVLVQILTTHPDPKIHNPDKAIELAQRAAEASNHRNPSVLNILAAAYASASRFEDAAKTAQAALDLATAAKNDRLADSIRKQLELYKQSKP